MEIHGRLHLQPGECWWALPAHARRAPLGCGTPRGAGGRPDTAQDSQPPLQELVSYAASVLHRLEAAASSPALRAAGRRHSGSHAGPPLLIDLYLLTRRPVPRASPGGRASGEVRPSHPLRHGPPQGAAQVKQAFMSHNLRGGLEFFTHSWRGAQCSLGHCTPPQCRRLFLSSESPAPRAGQGGVPSGTHAHSSVSGRGRPPPGNHTGQPEPLPAVGSKLELNIAGVHGWGERNPSLRRSPQAPGGRENSLRGRRAAVRSMPESQCVPFFPVADSSEGKRPPEEGDEDPSDNQMLPALAPGNRRDSPVGLCVGEAQHSSTHTTCLCCRDSETRPQPQPGGSGPDCPLMRLQPRRNGLPGGGAR